MNSRLKNKVVLQILGESIEPKDEALPVIEDTKPVNILRCPHCQEEIYEKHSYLDESGVHRHSDCGGAIKFPPPSPETQQWLDQLKKRI